jgi:hypothetical protein
MKPTKEYPIVLQASESKYQEIFQFAIKIANGETERGPKSNLDLVVVLDDSGKAKINFSNLNLRMVVPKEIALSDSVPSEVTNQILNKWYSHTA